MQLVLVCDFVVERNRNYAVIRMSKPEPHIHYVEVNLILKHFLFLKFLDQIEVETKIFILPVPLHWYNIVASHSARCNVSKNYAATGWEILG